MIGAHILGHKQSTGKIAAIAGLTAVAAGVALVYAIPKTRKACGRIIGDIVDRAKQKMGSLKNNAKAGGWERDLTNAEKLKGPVKNRKDASAIKVASAGTTAWKDEWSSE